MVRSGNDFVKEWDGINGILRARKQEEATPGALLKEATGVFKSPISIGDANRKANEKAREGTTLSDADGAKSPAKHFFADGTPEFEKFLSGGGGFKDMFTHFDPKGELAELHGNEIVANEDQMKRFVQQMMPPMSPSAENRQSKSSTPSTTDVKDATKLDQVPATPQLTDISKTFTDINTEMKGVAKQFNEIADKFKNITFAPQAKEMHETVTKAIEKATPQIKPVDVKPTETPKKEDTTKAAEVKPAEPPKAETKPADVKPAEEKKDVKPADVKPAEEKKEEKPAANPFKLVEQQSIAQLGEQFNKLIKTNVAPKDIPVPKIPNLDIANIKPPKSVEEAAATALNQSFEHLSKTVVGPLNEVKSATAEKTKASVQQPVKPKAPDVSQLDASLLNLAKFKQSMNSGDISKIGMSQMDLSDSGKAAEDKLGPSAARMALQKKREALENASFDYEQMKADNTKPSAESAEKLAKKKEEVAKLALAYEDDLIKTKGKLKLHAEEEAKNAELKNKTAKEAQAKQVAQALESEKNFMKEHSATAQSLAEKSKVTNKPIKEMTDAEKNFAMYSSGNKLPPPEPEGIHSPKDPKFDQLREQLGSSFKSLDATIKPAGLPKLEEITTKYEPPKEEPKEKGFFDSISDTFSDVGSSIAGVFKSDNKPGFAKGNVKYEEISQEEKDAADKRSQEGIGKVDHSPEATAARIAELNRQHSSYYKQKPDIKDDKSKEPAKIDDKSKVEPPKADIKPPVETKEQAHVKEMYKKFGLETFNDYNTRISAEVKQSHASIKDVKKDHATITSQDVKQSTPVEKPKAVEPIKPATPPPAAPAPVSKDVTLKDLHEALMQLNKTMTQMVHHTDTISNNSHKQIKATKSLSDNRLG
jgi:hypothetical protein